MRIGINALAWVPGEQAGVESYLRELIAALQEIDNENEYVVFVGRDAAGQFDLYKENFREVVASVLSRWRVVRAIWEQTVLAKWVREEGVDVLLCAGGVVPLNLGVATVQVIHDLQVMHYPENFGWLKRQFLRCMLPRSAEAATVIIASSEYTRGDVIEGLGQPGSKVRVVLLAGGSAYQPSSRARIAQIRRKYGIEVDYLLCVATTHRHKNLPRLVNVFDTVRSARELKCDLVLVGKAGAGQRELTAAVREADCRENIKVLGKVAAEDLAALYSGARAFVLPSLFEGFGMTVLEAMQCGCPVACSKLTALSEIVGEAALLFDPRDDHAFAEAVRQITEDGQLRGRLREKGWTQASKLSWAETAWQTRETLVEAARVGDE